MRNQPPWDPPIAIHPQNSQNTHTHTMILLPSSSKGPSFTKKFLRASSLPTHFPTTKFIFPLARRAPTSPLWRFSKKRSWLHHSNSDSDTTLRHTVAYIRALLFHEASELKLSGLPTRNSGFDRLVLAGCGDGAAVAMVALLGMRYRVGGYVGMDGWFVYDEGTERALVETEEWRWERRVRALRRCFRPGTGLGAGNEEEGWDGMMEWAFPGILDLDMTCSMDRDRVDVLAAPLFLGRRVHCRSRRRRRRRQRRRARWEASTVLFDLHMREVMGMEVTARAYEIRDWVGPGSRRFYEDVAGFLQERVGVPGGLG
ncbi:hypothetical protein BJX61DRAFT_542153 [Aspergillus egyptiacus]|nr:hypothetical protein BJX61DRAFT_542153 [Aspergillus egyptiacus]